MKKMISRTLCLVLAICMCFSLVACGGRDVGGLGSLDMDDEGSGGIGALGEPKDSDDEPSEPTESQTPPEPQQTPDASSFETEVYECSMFTVTIPKGWTVDYDVVNVGTADVPMERIYLFVCDPSDSRNMFFYVSAMEPFFLSVEGKNAWLPYVADYFKYAPVISEPTAEEVLRNWPSLYTYMQAEDGPLEPFFSNYSVSEVIKSESIDSTTSYALANVNIPSAGQYYMFYQSTFSLTNPPAGISSSGTYYVGYNNMGIVLTANATDSELEAVQACLGSLDLSGFANKN